MFWTIVCQGCGQRLRVHEDQEARSVRCPACEATILVRRPDPPADPTVAPVSSRRRWLIVGGAILVLFIGGAGAALSARLNWAPDPPAPPPRGAFPEGGRGPMRMGLMPGGPVAPGRLEMALIEVQPVSLSDGIEVPLFAEGKTVPIWKQAGRLPPCLAVTSDPQRGVVFTSTREGGLCWYDRASYRLLGSTQLAQPAYHLALDSRRGLLYTASCHPASLALGMLGDRESAAGDLHVYDVGALLRDATPSGSLTPLRTIPVGGHVTSFFLSPGGDHLYYVSEGGPAAQFRLPGPDALREQFGGIIGQFDTRARGRHRTLPIRAGGPAALSLAPDGRKLYGLCPGQLFSIDPDRWEFQSRVPIGGTVTGLVAVPGGRVVLLERRFRTQLMVFDMERLQLLSRWQASLEGRIYLLTSPAGDRLFVGTSALTQGQILAVDIAGDRLLRPTVLRNAPGNEQRLLRGPIFLAADGSAVFTAAGPVFLTAS